MQEGQNARQQIVERIRQSTSILVALSNNPSVDALAASFALSLMLTKMNKHSTAVFSGVIPPAIQFLEPNKTFENNVDALRDFIISLDKEKADRLRYKVEDDVVRIFITPYKTSITEKDLEFSQGDFNVDLIIALGVEKREDLDKAIVAHGRILHDATIITVNSDAQRSSLGSIDWNDGSSSSLCEMLVTLSEAFQQPGLLDAQISTALLTGIVAATERFSNTHTSPRVMTMAAQLMAAGANQQLIATNLAKAQEVPVAAPAAAGTLAKQPPSTQPAPMQEEPPKKKEPGELDITHEKKQEPAPAPAPTPAPQPPKQPEKPAPAPQPPKSAEDELAAAMPTAGASHSFIALKDELENAGKKQEGLAAEPKAPGSASVNGDEEEIAKQPEHEEDYISSHSSWKGKRLEPPTLGGTLNATTEEAMEDSQKAVEEDRNKTLLTHTEDKSQQHSKRKNKKDRERRVIEPPAEAAQPAPAPTPAPTPAPSPAPQPKAEPAPEPTPVPAAAPVAPPDLPPLPPVPTFTPAQEPMPALPPAPAPVAPSQPEQPPVPTLAPEPAPAPQPAPAPEAEPNLDSLAASAAEAAAAAQPAAAAVGDLDNARQAVTNALESAPFDPAHHPLESTGSQDVPAMPNMPVSEPLSQNALQALPPAPAPTSAPTPAPAPNDLPPLPPMPPMPTSSDALPPAPNLPGLNQPLPPMAPDVSTQIQTPPTPPAPSDPGQFKIPGA